MPDFGTIGSANVEIRAKLDKLDRDLAGAQSSLTKFADSTSSATQQVQKFSDGSDDAATSAAKFSISTEALQKQLTAVNSVNLTLLQSVQQQAAMMGVLATSTAQATAAEIDHRTGIIATGKSLVETALDFGKWIGYVTLVTRVANAGSPAFKQFTNSLVDVGRTGVATAAQSLPTVEQAFNKVGSAVAKAGQTISTFHPMLGIVGTATAGLGLKIEQAGLVTDRWVRNLPTAQQVVEKFGGGIAATGAAVSALHPSLDKLGQSVTGMGKNMEASAAQVYHLGTNVKGATKVVKELGDVAGLADIANLATNFSLASAAAYGMSPAIRSVVNEDIVNGIKAIPAGIKAVAPAVTSAASAISDLLLPRIRNLISFFGPLVLLAGAIEGIVASFRLGQSEVAKFDDTAARGLGLSADAANRFREAVTDANLSVETFGKTFAQLKEKSTPALEANKKGFGELEETLNKLIEQGNFLHNTGVELIRQATTEEARFRAVAMTVTQAMQAGEKLAAIKLAATFLPPDMLDRLRQTPTLLSDIVKAADKKIDVIDQENITRAKELKAQIDAAYKILYQDWTLGVMPLLKKVSLELYGVWVNIVSAIAKAVDWASNLGDRLGTALENARKLQTPQQPLALTAARGTAAQFRQSALSDLGPAVGSNMDPRAVLTQTQQLQADEAAAKALAEANQKLFEGFDNLKTKLSEMTTPFQQVVDKSKELTDALQDASKTIDTSAWDKYTKGVEKSLRTQQAMAEAADRGSVALARTKLTIEATSQAEDHLGKVTADAAKWIKEHADEAAGYAATLEGIQWEKEIVNIGRHTAQMMADARAVDQGTGVQERYRVQQQLLIYAEEKHLTITPKMAAEINKLSTAAEMAANELARMKIASEIRRGRESLFFTDQDVQIADKLKDIFPKMADALKSNQAAAMRLNDALKEIRDNGQTFVTDFVMGMRQGETAIKSVLSALNKLADQLLQLATKQVYQNLFGALAKAVVPAGGAGTGIAMFPRSTEVGAVGGAEKAATETANTTAVTTNTAAITAQTPAVLALSTALPLNTAALSQNTSALMTLGSFKAMPTAGEFPFQGPMQLPGTGGAVLPVAPSMQSGGVVGSAGEMRFVNPSMFIGAPRFQAGSDEVPSILHRGETVIPKGGMPAVHNNISIENHGADIQKSSKKNASGGMDVRLVVRKMVSDDFASGHYDNVFAQRLGIRPQTARR